MRPECLRVCRFGPFSAEQTVSFRNEADFFLITGPTGSGKTTVFDAILFALYGSLSGTRNPASAVSGYMPEYSEPFSEFTFAIRGSRYKIKRVPRHDRPARRGSGTVEQPENVSFFRFRDGGWAPVEGKVTEINAEVERLLHLSKDEFSRIVLLPQGEFQNFLVAPTDQKRAILMKLFPVREHEDISKRARDIKNDARAALNIKNLDLKRLGSELNPDRSAEELEGLKLQLKEKEDAAAQIQLKYDVALIELEKGRSLQKAFEEKKARFDDLNALKEKLPEIERIETALLKVIRAEKLRPVIEDASRLRKELEETESRLAELQKEKTSAVRRSESAGAAASRRPELEKFVSEGNSELGRLRPLLAKSTALIEKKNEAAELKAFTESVKTESEKASREYDALCAEAASLKEIIAQNAISPDDIREKRNGLVNSEKHVEQIRARDAALEKRKSYVSEAAAAREEIERINKVLDINRFDEAALAARKEAAAAAGLAAGLEEGRPCPVCGSLSHPAPADGAGVFTDDERLAAVRENIAGSVAAAAAAEERLRKAESLILEADSAVSALGLNDEDRQDEAEEQLEKLRHEVEALEVKISLAADARHRLDEKDVQLKESAARLGLLKDKISSAESRLASAEASALALEADLEGIDNIQNRILETEEKVKAAGVEIKSIDAELSNAGLELKRIQGREGELSEAAARLRVSAENAAEKAEKGSVKEGFDSAAEAERYFRPESVIKEQQEKVQRFRDSLREAEIRLHQSEENLKGKTEPVMRVLEEAVEALNLKKKDADREVREAASRIDRLQGLIAEYTRVSAESARLQDELVRVDEIAGDLNGDNPRRINFQNFVLSAYLSEVASAANLRFNRMTEGRYSMSVSTEIEDGRSQAGLELEVFDSFSGRPRSVKSLSGGEKFLASISLSLGLADVIQSRAGEIELDSVFIDEGFGTLDEASLDRALSILDEVRCGRMVGIISHVQELRNRIPSQIRIVKSQTGSRIEQTG